MQDEEPKCALLSRLPSPLAPARPGGTVWERATGAATYNPKCASGYSEGERFSCARGGRLEAGGLRAPRLRACECGMRSRSITRVSSTQPRPLSPYLHTHNTPTHTNARPAAAAKVLSELQSSCRAKIHPNTALSDATAAWVVGAPGAGGGGAIGALFRRPSRDLDIQYDAAQPTASACCQLCESLRGRGCTAWTFTPNPVGFMVDRSRRCALRTGLGPSMARAAGVTSGVMQ